MATTLVSTGITFPDATTQTTKSVDTVYTHPTTDGSKHVPAASSSASGQLLTSTGTSTEPTWQDAPQGVSNSKLYYFGGF